MVRELADIRRSTGTLTLPTSVTALADTLSSALVGVRDARRGQLLPAEPVSGGRMAVTEGSHSQGLGGASDVVHGRSKASGGNGIANIAAPCLSSRSCYI